MVMSDALPANQSGNLPVIIDCFCLAHGFRKVNEISNHFPTQSQRVLVDLGLVFELDQYTRDSAMDAHQRLLFHQSYSQPTLDALQSWLQQQLDDQLVEPNGSLGKAFAYLLKHWEGLTQFLVTPGAPIDSNWVERILKSMIRQRKHSLFFASEHGAGVACWINSVIATCAEHAVNAMDYLIAVMENAAAVAANPQQWLPWNYRALNHAA